MARHGRTCPQMQAWGARASNMRPVALRGQTFEPMVARKGLHTNKGGQRVFISA